MATPTICTQIDALIESNSSKITNYMSNLYDSTTGYPTIFWSHTDIPSNGQSVSVQNQKWKNINIASKLPCAVHIGGYKSSGGYGYMLVVCVKVDSDVWAKIINYIQSDNDNVNSDWCINNVFLKPTSLPQS